MISYSKEGQDIFAKNMCGKKGYFLDIGCSHPIWGNNTYSLELCGWEGILIDSNQNDIMLCKKERQSKSFCMNCKKIDWISFLEENNCPQTIDYISLDIDKNNIEVINRFPFHKYEFKTMTLETDVRWHGTVIHDLAVKTLPDHYFMLLENGKLNENDVWEDWWLNSKFFENKRWLQHKNCCWENLINCIMYGKML